MDPQRQSSGGSQQPTSPHPRYHANATGEVSVTQGHDQPGSEMRPPSQYVDGMAGSRNGVVNENTLNAARESNNMSQEPSNQKGVLVDPTMTSSGQNFPSRSMNIKDLRVRGMALYGRLKSGETLTAAESAELEMIKNVMQRVKDQSKKDQTAQNSSLYVGQPQQANSLVFSAPPQHVQNPEMSIEGVRMRLVHLQEKQESRGLTALEVQDFRALCDWLRQKCPGRQQGNLQAGGTHAVPSPSRAASSQHQATMPGSTPLVKVAALSTASPRGDGIPEVSRHRPCTPQQISENQQDSRHCLAPPRSHSSTNDPGNATDARFRDLSNFQTAGQRPEAHNFNIRYNSNLGYNSNQIAGTPTQEPQQEAPRGQQYQGQARQQSYDNMQGQFIPRQPQLQGMPYQKHLPPTSQAIAQTSSFQAESMPPQHNTTLVQGISHHQSELPNLHFAGPEYRQYTTPTASIAGQKHSLYGNERAQDGNRAKRARVDAPLDANYSAGQMQSALKQTPNPGGDTSRLQEQPKITLPLGNLDPKVAQETLRKVYQVMQTGGTLVPVPPGMKAVILPQHSFIACRPQDSPSVFIGSSDTTPRSWNKIATRSFIQGFEASKEHQRKMQAGIPYENIKVAVFDNRQNQMEPVSKPMQSSSIDAKSGESNDETTVARGQETRASEDTQFKGPTFEDDAMMVTAQKACPGATAGSKRPLSAVQEELCPAGDLDQAEKKVATAALNDDSLAADNRDDSLAADRHQVEQESHVASPESQPSIPWVPTREEAQEKDMDDLVDRAIEEWNARPSPEPQDEWEEWRERFGWQDTDGMCISESLLPLLYGLMSSGSFSSSK